MLIYYGAARHAWVDIKLRSLMKASGYGEAVDVKTVYVAPPEDRRKERFRTRLADIIRQENAFDPALLESFVQQVKEAKRNRS